MTPDVRRIVAVEAHRRRTGNCPTLVHSLGTGETFEIDPTAEGFFDMASGLDALIVGAQIRLSSGGGCLDLALAGDVGFTGYDHETREAFTGRVGGGTTVTVYDATETNYFQYAIECARAPR